MAASFEDDWGKALISVNGINAKTSTKKTTDLDV